MGKCCLHIHSVSSIGESGVMSTYSPLHHNHPDIESNNTDTNRQARIIAEAMRKKSFATLATVSAAGRSRCAGLVYADIDGSLWVHTMRSSRKGRNVAANPDVGMCVHHDAGRLDAIIGHDAMHMDGSCFLRIAPEGTIHSFGPGVPIVDLARNPLQTGARRASVATVLANA